MRVITTIMPAPTTPAPIAIYRVMLALLETLGLLERLVVLAALLEAEEAETVVAAISTVDTNGDMVCVPSVASATV